MEGFRKPICEVWINGVNYTSRFMPLVKKIEVADKDGLVSDKCSIKLADPDGSIAMPEGGDDIRVLLGHDGLGVGLVFEGKIDEVRCTFTKGGGREMSISAKGVDAAGKAKQPLQKHKDDAKFGDVAKEWGKAAGMKEVVVSPGLASIEDDYWSMQNESFMAWGQRVARDLGATFKIQGGRAIFVEANGGTTASGKDIPDFLATWGDNLLRGDISPVMQRPRHQKVKVEYYDPKSGKMKSKEAEVADSGNSTTLQGRYRASSEKTADRKAKAGKKRVERNAGEGSITVVGDAAAKPEGKCILAGVREGVDGEYRITGVQHDFSRKGYDMTLDLKQPGGKAGKDGRRKKSSGASAGTASPNPPDPNNAL